MSIKPKLYVYEHVGPSLHETTPGFENSIPMTAAGREKHFDIVNNPDNADYFYMGQVPDKHVALINHDRYPYLKGREARHIIDCEGDWRDYDQPELIRDSFIITGHARIQSLGNYPRRFVRPVISPLMMRLVKGPVELGPHERRGFWFQGQLDFTRRYREKVLQAVVAADVPGDWQWNGGWSCYADENSDIVKSYLEKARIWSYALCPVGEGPSCRFYEMALLGRIGILIGDYEPFEGGVVRWSISESVDYLASNLRQWMNQSLARDDELKYKIMGYRHRLLEYFNDPTFYFLRWAKNRAVNY